MNEDKLNLSNREKRFLLLCEKNVIKIFWYYLVAGFFLCTAIVGLILGIKLNVERAFFGAIFFATLSWMIFAISIVYQKSITIINKMKQYIEELESEKLR